MTVKKLQGDCREILKTLDTQSVHCCVTSPPYWNMRDYGVKGQIGLEKSIEEYISVVTDVFREVRRVLRDDGTLWLNMGDGYSGGCRESNAYKRGHNPKRIFPSGLKPKNLMGLPWKVAFALQDDGWFLRCDIIWHKTNAMPESVLDRPMKAHEYLFLLSKSPQYYYDIDSTREPLKKKTRTTYGTKRKRNGGGELVKSDNWGRDVQVRKPKINAAGRILGANKRTIWSVATRPYDGVHFATYPPGLIQPCILAGCPPGGIVLDPFGGSGTTGMVATQLRRNSILIELNPEYITLQDERCSGVQVNLF